MGMTAKEMHKHVYYRLDDIVPEDEWRSMICKYLTTQQLEEMLDMNEYSPRFMSLYTDDPEFLI